MRTLSGSTAASADVALAAPGIGRVFLVLECAGVAPQAQLDRLSTRLSPEAAFALGADPFADLARGLLAPTGLAGARDALVQAAAHGRREMAASDRRDRLDAAVPRRGRRRGRRARDRARRRASAYLESLVERRSLRRARPRASIMLRLAVGPRHVRRAVQAARAPRRAGARSCSRPGAHRAPRALVHAVCSSRTLAAARSLGEHAARDDAGLRRGPRRRRSRDARGLRRGAGRRPRALGRRVARNTGLVLREESASGKVKDPRRRLVLLRVADRRAGARGVEALPGASSAKAASSRRSSSGGLRDAARSGVAASGSSRIAKRKVRVLGVSEFAQPRREAAPPGASERAASPPDAAALPRPPRRRAVRGACALRADASPRRAAEALLVALGPLAESRPRVGFASNFFGAGGIRAREATARRRRRHRLPLRQRRALRRRGGGPRPRAQGRRLPRGSSSPAAPARSRPRSAKPASTASSSSAATRSPSSPSSWKPFR